MIGGQDTVSFHETTKRIGRFELVSKVGTGRFGSVWKARDTELDRIVAVKIPRAGDVDELEANQFFREARAAAQIRHPNIVGVHEFGRDKETVFIVSDFVDGANLKEYLSGQAFTFRESAEICRTIAAALHSAHEVGVVHRDLKPGNILLDCAGKVYLTDFGLAKREAGEITMTADGRILGTPAYMSPEQACGKGHSADRRSDIYSLGVLLYELLTGELPFRGERQMLLLQIQRDDPVPPRKLNRHIPRDLETICLKCMEKEPHRRYACAADLANDLGRYVNGKPISIRPAGKIEKVWRWCRRHPAQSGLYAVSAVACFAIVAFSVVYAYQRRLAQANVELESAWEAERQLREELDRSLYIRRVSQSLSEWKSGQLAAAESLLERCMVSQRGWEWQYVRSLCRSEHLRLSGHKAVVHSAQFSPDGQQVLTASSDGTARLWDVTSGQQLISFEGHQSGVNQAAFNSDGSLIATASDDQTVKLWDAGTREVIVDLKGHTSPVIGVEFLANDEHVVTTTKNEAKIWDVNGRELHTLDGHSERILRVAGSPDGRWIATAGWDDVAILWDAATAEEVRRFAGHDHGIIGLSFRSDGQQIATASEDTTAKIWDVNTGAERMTFRGHIDAVYEASFSPDGTKLVTASEDTTVKVWDTTTGEMLFSLPAHTDEVRCAAWDPSGELLVTGSADQAAKIWRAGPLDDASTLRGHKKRILGVCISPDGKRIATSSADATVKVWNATTYEELFQLGGNHGTVNDVAFHPYEPRLIAACEDGTVQIWDLESRKELLMLEPDGAGVTCATYSPDGKLIVTVSGRRVTAWDAEMRIRVVEFVGHKNDVEHAAFSPDGTRLSTASLDNTLRIWDSRTGQELHLVEAQQPLYVAFDNKGRQLVAPSGDAGHNEVSISDTRTGQKVRSLQGHFSQGVNAAIFTPDDRRVVSGGDDATIRIWDAASGDELLTLRGHEDGVECLAVSPDGMWIVSGSEDGTAKIWGAPQMSVVDRAPVSR